jgi:hypothetical protein
MTPVIVPYGKTGFSVDKCLKLHKPLGTIYLSTEPRPIKAANTAPSETTRANDIAIETAKTGKVTAVVMVMSIFSEKRCKLRSVNCRNEMTSRQKAESVNFPEENTRGLRSFSQKMRKGRIPKKSAPKLKKLELNCTNLELNSKQTRSCRAKTAYPSVSSGLKVKNKTIRVLLDSGSIGDLLFMKKGSSKRISAVKQVVPQSCGTSNGTFITDRVGNIEFFLWSTQPARRFAFSWTL